MQPFAGTFTQLLSIHPQLCLIIHTTTVVREQDKVIKDECSHLQAQFQQIGLHDLRGNISLLVRLGKSAVSIPIHVNNATKAPGDDNGTLLPRFLERGLRGIVWGFELVEWIVGGGATA